MNPPPESKEDLRRRFSESRRALSEDDRDAARARIRSTVLERVEKSQWRVVAAYVPLRTEPGSVELLDGLVALGCRVLVPVTLPDRDLDWTMWPPATPPSSLGRESIRGAGLILVPALAVAENGTRLGRGGGSYDRALARRAPAAVTAALLFDGEVAPDLPSESWDVPVSDVVTPAGWSVLLGNTGAEADR